MSTKIHLPGDIVASSVPNGRVGPGLFQPSTDGTAVALLAGPLQLPITSKSLPSIAPPPQSTYTPRLNDLVLARVMRSAAETYHCSLSPHTPAAILPHLA